MDKKHDKANINTEQVTAPDQKAGAFWQVSSSVRQIKLNIRVSVEKKRERAFNI